MLILRILDLFLMLHSNKSLLKDSALKKLIANVVETSIATKAWSTTLEDFYKDNGFPSTL